MQPSRADSLGAAGVALAQALSFGWAILGSPPYAFYSVLKWSSLIAACYVGWALFQRSRALAPVSFILLSLGLLHATANMRKDEWPAFNAAGGLAFAVACIILALQRSPQEKVSPHPSPDPAESELDRRFERAKSRESLIHRFSLAISIVALLAAGVWSFFVPASRAPAEVRRYAEVRGGVLLEASAKVELLLDEFAESTIYSEWEEGEVFDSLATYKSFSEREGIIVTCAGSTLISLDALLEQHARESPSTALNFHEVQLDFRSVRDWLSGLRDQVRIVRDDVPKLIRSKDLDPILDARDVLRKTLKSKPAFSVASASVDQYAARIASGNTKHEGSSFGWFEDVAFSLLPLALLAVPPWPWLLLWLGADDQRFYFLNGLTWGGSPIDPYERLMTGVWYCLRLIGCVLLWVISGAMLRHVLNLAATADSVAYVGLPAAPFAVLVLGLLWGANETFRYGLAPQPGGLDSALDGPLILVSVLSLVCSFFLFTPL